MGDLKIIIYVEENQVLMIFDNKGIWECNGFENGDYLGCFLCGRVSEASPQEVVELIRERYPKKIVSYEFK